MTPTGTDYTTDTADLMRLVRDLRSADIRERIEQLDRDRQALMVLLRVAIRSERDPERPVPTATRVGAAPMPGHEGALR